MSATATPTIRESDLVPQPQFGPNAFSVNGSPAYGNKRWLTVLPDGSFTTSDDLGEYQIGYRVDDKLFFECHTQYPTGSYGFPIWVGR